MIRVNRVAFAEMLARVEPGRSTRNFLEQSSCYIFQGGWVSTFNDEVCCRTKTDFPDEVEGAVQGRHLKDTLDGLTDEEVTVSVEGPEFRLTTPRKKAGIRLEREVRLPVDQVETPESWTPLDNPDAFAKAVKLVTETAGKDEEEFMTVCVHVTPSALEATDRWQASRYEVATGFQAECLVRAKSLRAAGALDITKVGETPNWAHFRNKALVISVRRHVAPFQDLAQHFAFTGQPVDLPRGAVEAAKLGGVFSADDKDNNKVFVFLEDGRMRVRGEGANGWAEAEPECGYAGPPVSFRISPKTLEDIVKDHQRCEVSPSKLLVRGDRWTYLTVLGAAKPTQAPAPAAAEEDAPAYAEGGDGDDPY